VNISWQAVHGGGRRYGRADARARRSGGESYKDSPVQPAAVFRVRCSQRSNRKVLVESNVTVLSVSARMISCAVGRRDVRSGPERAAPTVEAG